MIFLGKTVILASLAPNIILVLDLAGAIVWMPILTHVFLTVCFYYIGAGVLVLGFRVCFVGQVFFGVGRRGKGFFVGEGLGLFLEGV